MNVLLHIRSDAEAKPGGDYSLLKTFARLLAQRGHRATVSLDCDADLSGQDVVLTINLDSPFEPSLLLDRARDRGVPLCLYTLHHPLPGFDDYLRHGVTGARKAMAMLAGRDPQRYLGLMAVARETIRGRRWRCARALRTRHLQQRLLTDAGAVLVSSRLERDQIAVDFPEAAARARFQVVPHVFERPSAAGPAKEPDLILCPGRIESRKNQLALVEAAAAFPRHRFVFVGALNPGERGYGRRFQAAISARPNASHLGGLDLAGFRAQLARAAVVASASWFEVVSLVELDALAHGCRLVAGRNSYLHEFATGGTTFFDPATPGALEDALAQAIAGADAQPAAVDLQAFGALAPEAVGAALDESLRAAMIRATP